MSSSWTRGKRSKRNWRGFRGEFPGTRRVRPDLSGRDDKWGTAVSEGERGGDTDSVTASGGPWAVFGCGLESVLGAFSSFSFLSPFLFLFSFDFCLKILQITSDLIQANFCKL
jgi:hypothetical protein